MKHTIIEILKNDYEYEFHLHFSDTATYPLQMSTISLQNRIFQLNVVPWVHRDHQWHKESRSIPPHQLRYVGRPDHNYIIHY